ncbi:MAG: hypothetical protein AAF569_07810 [Pseudomonadota bacterium]
MTENDDSNLQGAFGDMGTKENAINYEHPYAEQILKEIKEVMRQCFMGSHLVEVSEHFNVPVRILKAKMVTGFVPDAGAVFLSAPASLNKYSPKLLLDMCKGLREAEQHLLGFRAPDENESVLNHAAILHAKNLDAITHMCRVVHELEKTDYYSILLDEIKKQGHSMIYKAYVSGLSNEETAEIYVETNS